jgi:alpha-galactosidase
MDGGSIPPISTIGRCRALWLSRRVPSTGQTVLVPDIDWGLSGLALTFHAPDDAPVVLASLVPGETLGRLQPLVEVVLLGEGRALSNIRMSHSGVGRRLRYVEHRVEHEAAVEPGVSTLRVTQADSATGLTVTSVFVQRAGIPAVQTWTEVVNGGSRELLLQSVSSFATSALLDADESVADVELWRGRSDWCAEGRWSALPVTGPAGLASINTDFHHHDDRGTLTTVSTSTWSSGTWLPTAVLANARTGHSVAFQLEHNGAWRWELDALRDGPNALALILNGPTDLDHQWTHRLASGGRFSSIPVSIAVSSEGHLGALAVLTRQRRALRRRNAADAPTAIVFNDYMNTLMGDPTTEKLLPLIDAAAAVGAEYFCIDAGWYDDGGAWWGSVGEWQPSTVRFPDGGLVRVLDHIRDRGMQLGLWLEPEVIGVRSPVARLLPDAAFLQRFGRRVVEHERYFLDLRHPAAIAHLDEVVDRLVGEYGARFFKLDYNVTPGAGTDLDALSAGDGLLDHNRAHLAWIDRMVARHPEVIFENCASGAMRLDYAMMSRLDLQSTSDHLGGRSRVAAARAGRQLGLPAARDAAGGAGLRARQRTRRSALPLGQARRDVRRRDRARHRVGRGVPVHPRGPRRERPLLAARTPGLARRSARRGLRRAGRELPRGLEPGSRDRGGTADAAPYGSRDHGLDGLPGRAAALAVELDGRRAPGRGRRRVRRSTVPAELTIRPRSLRRARRGVGAG